MNQVDPVQIVYSRAQALYRTHTEHKEQGIGRDAIESCNNIVAAYNVIAANSGGLPKFEPIRFFTYDDGTASAVRTDLVTRLADVIGSLRVLAEPKRSAAGKNLFIGHGRKLAPLNVVVRYVEALGHNPIVVKDEPSKGGSVNPVVEGYLASCSCAILLFTRETEKDGIWHASENVINEEGLARKYVGEKIIYLVEEGVKLPSNFSEKVYGSFTEGNMTEALIKLARELRAFGLL